VLFKLVFILKVARIRNFFFAIGTALPAASELRIPVAWKPETPILRLLNII
jgi:hypothetical protein